jgi:phage terminase large subunit-like protein
MSVQPIEIRPQPKQEEFLSHPADIVIYGGGAGGGKSFATLLDPLRDVSNPGFGAVIFRRELEMVTNEGGLWDESHNIYSLLGAKPNGSKLVWTFPSGARVGFDGVKQEQDVTKHQGSQFAALYFEELTHFTEYQFWYLQSRCRTTCGVRPRVRATLNPDPTSWVFRFLAPWVDPEWVGEKAKSGETRWFVRKGGDIEWVEEGTPSARSVTFIKALLSDNLILEQQNPEYRAFLESLDEVERARLLDGEWRVQNTGGLFTESMFEVVPISSFPPLSKWYRAYDCASKAKTSNDYTAWVKFGVDQYGQIWVSDYGWEHLTWPELCDVVQRKCQADGGATEVFIEDASAGVQLIYEMTNVSMRPEMAGFIITPVSHEGRDKYHHATPVASRARLKPIKVADTSKARSWINFFLKFDGLGRFPDDPVDSLSVGWRGAFKQTDKVTLHGKKKAIAKTLGLSFGD